MLNVRLLSLGSEGQISQNGKHTQPVTRWEIQKVTKMGKQMDLNLNHHRKIGSTDHIFDIVKIGTAI